MMTGKAVPNAVDEYIAAAHEPARAMLTKMRAAIQAALPEDAVEVISYRMPAFKLGKIVVWFAAFRSHCSLFPTAAVIDRYRNELTGYKCSKGTIQFPLDKPLPVALIKRLARASMELIESERAGKKRKS